MKPESASRCRLLIKPESDLVARQICHFLSLLVACERFLLRMSTTFSPLTDLSLTMSSRYLLDVMLLTVSSQNLLDVKFSHVHRSLLLCGTRVLKFSILCNIHHLISTSHDEHHHRPLLSSFSFHFLFFFLFSFLHCIQK